MSPVEWRDGSPHYVAGQYVDFGYRDRWQSCAEPPAGNEPMGSTGVRLNEDCPRCGHVVVLHSRSRGCVGCRLEPEVTR